MDKEAAGWKDNVSSQKQRASHGKVFFLLLNQYCTNHALVVIRRPASQEKVESIQFD